MKLFLFLLFISKACGFNVLMVSIGAAGHIIPMFELAKGMKNHNVTFLTESRAQAYINLESYSNLSSFHPIISNNPIDISIHNTKYVQDVISYITNHSLIDSLDYLVSQLSPSIGMLMNKTVHMLMEERFDVIIGTSLIPGLHALCNDANISCIIQIAEQDLNIFDVTLPDSFSLLSTQQLMKFQYRIYNVAFTIRLVTSVLTKLINIYSTIFQSLPQVPGPFYETFTLKNLLFTKSKCLKLFSLPPTLYPSFHLSYMSKYLGAFIDESSLKNIDNDLTIRWLQSKEDKSVVYIAFGSISIVDINRMESLINGLAEFLLQTNSASALLAFRHTNFDTYQIVFNGIKNEKYRHILMNDQRVRIENGFIQQKSILQSNSISLFLSHCGMGSIVEGLYFENPILCLPLCTDQFTNAMTIEHSGAGESLFQPPSILKSFQKPMFYHDYIFSAREVTNKLSVMWRNITYERIVRIMSLEMKHAGGVKRAVEEIEFFVHLNGDIDRYRSFPDTLLFYQRYMIDLIIVYIILPIAIIWYLFIKCCKRNRKQKND